MEQPFGPLRSIAENHDAAQEQEQEHGEHHGRTMDLVVRPVLEKTQIDMEHSTVSGAGPCVIEALLRISVRDVRVSGGGRISCGIPQFRLKNFRDQAVRNLRLAIKRAIPFLHYAPWLAGRMRAVRQLNASELFVHIPNAADEWAQVL